MNYQGSTISDAVYSAFANPIRIANWFAFSPLSLAYASNKFLIGNVWGDLILGGTITTALAINEKSRVVINAAGYLVGGIPGMMVQGLERLGKAVSKGLESMVELIPPTRKRKE